MYSEKFPWHVTFLKSSSKPSVRNEDRSLICRLMQLIHNLKIVCKCK